MVAEYEDSPECLEDELQYAFLDQRKPPVVRAKGAASPLDRPALNRSMSMELDNINIGPPAYPTITTPATAPAARPAHTAGTSPNAMAAQGTNTPDPLCMSPLITTHPSAAGSKLRPTPTPGNPWYSKPRSSGATEDHLFIVLKSVLHSCRKWNLEFSPTHFRDFARKARVNWNTTNPELRRMAWGLRELHEFLVCGPEDFTLSHALSTKSFEAMREVVDAIMPHLQAVIGIDGCGWLDEQVRSPLMGVDEQLVMLLQERKEYKDGRWNRMPVEERLPYQVTDLTMEDE